ncbi:Glycogen debranching enzyme (alpha-1,6-glucosidase) [Micromonospora rhizosphaerae]|uniref:Glycogen debranching enzyme (Alpha-1,6-glucosidase) n=1 Tax=Micromonospora rhizosphaerae TaxID=568872 RepID=A0A1C6RWW3_9ACTN|nr:glycogen debranching N-terminal domain-containing protein [Micromonospora rhizosphaerae]SCL21698.1 Glycogen debranching enzyme (alpha-1,6-glucosidase) [Micromonospora rhizosphaerae]
MIERHLQPLLHDLVGVVFAPTSALGDESGQIRPAGVQGVFHADARVLSRAELRIDEREPEGLIRGPVDPHTTRFVALARWLGDPGADPTVRLDRIRRAHPKGISEELRIVSTASVPVRATVSVDLGCDLAPIEVVKSGGAATALEAKAGQPGQLTWAADGITVTVTGEAAEADAAGERAVAPRLSWPVDLAPGGTATLRWRLTVEDPKAVVIAPSGEPAWSRPEVRADDRRLARLLDRSLADLRGLRLADPAAPEDVFLGAGVPWFLTLFGRDSLWAARMMLPLGTELAAGTLRVLARRQGARVDPTTGEAPGKILHELRRHEFSLAGEGLRLPPAYYGTVDATMLWISLLHDAWRWGLAAEQVEPLLPHLEAALGWLGEHADADGDGLVEYVDTTGHGLSNQGWKDSGDAVRFRDGRLATPPIVLAEVQGYAYRAAMDGAALLDAFDRPGSDRWRAYAHRLAERFRAAFWVDGRHGPHPALALDRDKRPVDSLTSNIGHLLGTGLLSDAESAQVAALLTADALAGGFGLRTMSTDDAGFSPLSYHCGSIWTHDTAIVLAGLARAGFTDAALTMAEGLLGAAEAFDYRLPELYGGDDRTVIGRPVPYPAACRPQAWSAAAAVLLLQAGAGLYPDVPAGRVHLRPLAGPELGALAVDRFRVAGASVDVHVDRAGNPTITGLPATLTVTVEPAERLAAAPVPTPRTPTAESPLSR